MEGSEESVEGEDVRVKILPSSQVALSVEYFGSEKEYASNAFLEARESAADVLTLKFKETGETSGSMTFTVVDSETLKVVEKGTTMERGRIRELRYTLRRINSALSPEPAPNPDLNPGPSPAPGGPVDLARLNGNWRPYDGRGTFVGPNGDVHEMVLKSTSLLTCTYIRPPSPYAGEVMILQTLNWASGERGLQEGVQDRTQGGYALQGDEGRVRDEDLLRRRQHDGDHRPEDPRVLPDPREGQPAREGRPVSIRSAVQDREVVVRARRCIG
ncbi:hypothetical protein [uncultured Fretibacterium sp.]|uniref:hypothetical protein n=1 Tax=uncultured Fretibacterium sp. TaxID=1678694 RepID=UPI0026329DE9|nr:hypothetical protein [uncultured Fretibacterium sp.]